MANPGLTFCGSLEHGCDFRSCWDVRPVLEKQAVLAAAFRVFGSLSSPLLIHRDIGTILAKSALTEGDMPFTRP